MNVISRLTAFTDFGASWILWLLISLSVIAVAVVIERAVLFSSSRDDIARLRNELRALLGRGQTDAARKKLEESPSFEARVAAAGLDADGIASAEERMQGETELARISMEKNLALLGTLGNNAPFVGLLGTVIGIVRAFREDHVSQMAHLIGGMAGAAFGFMIASGKRRRAVPATGGLDLKALKAK